MTEGEKQLRTEYRQLQDKRVYFLLAAAGASIAFATTQLDTVPASKALLVALIALLLLGTSFVSGIWILVLEEKLVRTNSQYLAAIPTFEAKGLPAEEFRKMVDEVSFDPLFKRKRFWMQAQIVTLFVGGMLLPVWKLAACEPCIAVMETIFVQPSKP